MHVTLAQPATRKPTFLWQGVLIVLPVAALVVVGLSFLQQDRRLALSEASERAELLAETLATRIWGQLVDTNNASAPGSVWVKVDDHAELLFPPEFSPTPPPSPLELSQLNAEQLELWARAEESRRQLASAGGEALSPAVLNDLVAACREFLGSEPPARFAALVSYQLGLLLAKQGEPTAAMEIFKTLSSSDAVAESGLPLGPLAQFQRLLLLSEDAQGSPPMDLALEQQAEKLRSFYSETLRRVTLPARMQIHLEEVCSRLVNQPTALTPYLLGVLAQEPRFKSATNAARAWQETWARHERLRQTYTSMAEPLKHRLPVKVTRSLLLPGSAHPAGITNREVAAFWFEEPKGLQRPAGVEAGRLAIVIPAAGGGNWVNCLGGEAGALVREAIGQARAVPEYMGIGVEIARRRIKHPAHDLYIWREIDYMTRSGGQSRKETTAEEATRILAIAGVPGVGLETFRVNVYLTNPSQLFNRQAARSFWIACLIACSAGAAFVGLLAGYRAFHRQLRLSELKSNFVSSVSHELRAPIASIRLMAESLDRGAVVEPTKQREYFGFIVRECRRLSDLIANVLDFSRIDQGRKRYEFEETDVRALVEQTMKVMLPAASERGVRLVCTHPKPAEGVTLDCVLMDGRAIQQALINLIDNAIKHSPPGETVTIGWERSRSATSRTAASPLPSFDPFNSSNLFNLWVEDHGPGIPQEEHERIFERFYRSGSELRRETQGVGIGLSIVKHIVEAHGGTVRLRSAPGQGSRFTIELPCNAS